MTEDDSSGARTDDPVGGFTTRRMQRTADVRIGRRLHHQDYVTNRRGWGRSSVQFMVSQKDFKPKKEKEEKEKRQFRCFDSKNCFENY